jgi:hypothetical protein
LLDAFDQFAFPNQVMHHANTICHYILL